jgi:hypothetical protein
MADHRFRVTAVGFAAALGLVALVTPAGAQTASTPSTEPAAQAAAEPHAANTGRISLTAGLDFASAYFFRGIFQEDEGLVTWPAFDVGVTLAQGDGALSKVAVNVGLWNSLHTGPSGSDGPADDPWYEADFYTSLTFAFSGGFTVSPIYTAYTSPNKRFGTVKELAVKFSYADAEALGKFAMSPYALMAFELEGNADGGAHSGKYLELGIAPGLPLAGGKASLTFPVKLGLSMSDYYEGASGNDTFGYFDVGVAGSVPLSFIGKQYGAWSLRGAVDVLAFGDNMKALHHDDGSAVVAQFGIGLSY